MKQLIVMLATVLLGVSIFQLVAGDENSVKTTVEEVWQQEIRVRTNFP
ncbi:MAG: hypothetical protein IJC68_01890 [Firmicutes bacterium]|nr:hypothetical protein [Bacillota bacterium]